MKYLLISFLIYSCNAFIYNNFANRICHTKNMNMKMSSNDDWNINPEPLGIRVIINRISDDFNQEEQEEEEFGSEIEQMSAMQEFLDK